MDDIDVTFTVIEVCQIVGLSRDELGEVVALGVITPQGESSMPWRFDAYALSRLRRARRLRYELDIDWPGIAMTLTLLDKMERLNQENQRLQRQLERFIPSR
ncbi:chaperone-modulator protein CbpM [Lonsdalea populi]|uniref:Chaperone-modulator protein CbpM n=1 Tax=Lonsdalea populi TaxID=1172565 RepID=A0A3N0UM45_9GAMM|nr:MULTISPECIES: chaperone modulator CbpM [Lonsdalea]RAT15531.1 chaperone-modulator protein CbpM [Lonsdalea quercina]RAT30246.1 chaperone-modulator protein CbpM [Lonsdalea populi]RAT32252.1 chaperone-modulator protein CbpM [Lonsdalea populi]RAT44852.1 chaperone-modulator protein CbpM [Lonsdalea populi]RAT50374.1 chaperone-modulator protein CbpM [Lonsdalea populi]